MLMQKFNRKRELMMQESERKTARIKFLRGYGNDILCTSRGVSSARNLDSSSHKRMNSSHKRTKAEHVSIEICR